MVQFQPFIGIEVDFGHDPAFADLLSICVKYRLCLEVGNYIHSHEEQPFHGHIVIGRRLRMLLVHQGKPGDCPTTALSMEGRNQPKAEVSGLEKQPFRQVVSEGRRISIVNRHQIFTYRIGF